MIGKFFRFFIPKILVIVSLVLAFWIGDVTMKEMDRGKRIREEIASLHVEAEKTQKENTLLREKIRYFQTDTFQEQEARNKLNYQSPDEQTVVIQSIASKDTMKEDSPSSILPDINTKTDIFLPNYEKWWKQFFTNS